MKLALALVPLLVGEAGAFAPVTVPTHVQVPPSSSSSSSALNYYFADGDDAATSSSSPLGSSAVNGASGYKLSSMSSGSRTKPSMARSSGASSKTSLGFFFTSEQGEEDATDVTAAEPVVIDPDFRVAGLFLAIGAVLDTIPWIQLTLGPLVTALGVLFLVQTFRLRFVFDETAFELATVAGLGSDELKSSGENVVVGGQNRWTTQSIFNYDFYPEGWIDGPIGPILVYFKEDQTPSETWNEGPGKIANDPAKVEAGLARPGQVHFFPAVANSQQLREEFAKRGCKKI